MKTLTCVVKVPQQTNSTDCGIYMLLFVEIIIQIILQKRQELSWEAVITEISEGIVYAKRAQIAMIYSSTQLNLGQKTISSMMLKPVKCPIAQPPTKSVREYGSLMSEQWQEAKKSNRGQ